MIDRLVPAPIRRNFRLEFISSLLIGVFLATVLNFVPVVARRMGATALELNLLVAAPMIGNLLTPLSVYTPPAHRFRALLIIWAVARSLFFLTVFITTPGPFVLIVVLFYMLMALPTPTYVEIEGSIYPTNVRGRAMSYTRAAMTGVMTMMTPIAGFMMDRVGYAPPFAIGAAVALVSTAVFSRIRPGQLSDRRTDVRKVFGILRRDRTFAIFSLSLMFMGTGYMLAASLFPIVQVDQLHLSYGAVGVLALLSSLCWMLGNVAMGSLLDRKGPVFVMVISLVCQTAMPLLYFLASDVVLVAVAFVCGGLAMAAGDLGWLNSVLLFSGAKRAQDYTALHSVLVGIRGIFGLVLGAILFTGMGIGIRPVLMISFVIQVIGVSIMLWVWVTYRSPRLGVPMSEP